MQSLTKLMIPLLDSTERNYENPRVKDKTYKSSDKLQGVINKFVDKIPFGDLKASSLNLNKNLVDINASKKTPEEIKDFFTLPFSLQKLFCSYLNLEDIKNIGLTQKSNKKLTQEIIVNFLNQNKIKLKLPLELNLQKLHKDLDENLCSKITNLNFQGLGEQDNFQFLENYPNLTSLNLGSRQKKIDFGFLANCKNLEELILSNCRLLNKLGFLEFCKKLKILNLSGCQIEDFIENGSNVLKFCPNLNHLNIFSNQQINNIYFVENCKKLKEFILSGCNNIREINWGENYPLLSYLNLSGCPITKLKFFEINTELVNLNLGACFKLEGYNFLKKIPHVKILNLSLCKLITDDEADFLKFCTKLEKLDLSNTGIKKIKFIEDLVNLVNLALQGCSIESLPIQYCKNLKTLNCRDCKNLKDIAFLENLNLEIIDLGNCIGIKDFSYLGSCKNLTNLDLRGCPQIDDVSYLFDLPLSILALPKNSKIPESQIHYLKEKKNVVITFY